MMLRRDFLFGTAAAAVLKGAQLNHKERVDRALKGSEVDRPPFSFWHHFGLKTAPDHAKRTLEFHDAYRTDFVKVMSDFPYPKPSRRWYELKVEQNPFPEQIRALEMIRDGVNGRKYFIETLFNPWNVAEKLSSKEEVRRLMNENPDALLHALDVITQSEINHAKRAFAAGASGVLFSVANAKADELPLEQYVKFSRPFDKRVMEAVSAEKLNLLHLHVEPQYLSQFRDFPPSVINYSAHVSGIPIADIRRQFSNVIAGGIDETKYRQMTEAEMKGQWLAAAKAAGSKFILTPGCSVPDDSTRQELEKLPRILGA
jgi:uroporphyrinogen-III decarboxylase